MAKTLRKGAKKQVSSSTVQPNLQRSIIRFVKRGNTFIFVISELILVENVVFSTNDLNISIFSQKYCFQFDRLFFFFLVR